MSRSTPLKEVLHIYAESTSLHSRPHIQEEESCSTRQQEKRTELLRHEKKRQNRAASPTSHCGKLIHRPLTAYLSELREEGMSCYPTHTSHVTPS